MLISLLLILHQWLPHCLHRDANPSEDSGFVSLVTWRGEDARWCVDEWRHFVNVLMGSRLSHPQLRLEGDDAALGRFHRRFELFYMFVLLAQQLDVPRGISGNE